MVLLHELEDENDLKLAKAYQALGIPIEGMYQPQDLAGYSVNNVQDMLVDWQDSKYMAILTFDFAGLHLAIQQHTKCLCLVIKGICNYFRTIVDRCCRCHDVSGGCIHHNTTNM